MKCRNHAKRGAKFCCSKIPVSDINTDGATRFYIGWLNMFGFTEAEHDDDPADNPDRSLREPSAESRQKVNGNKMQLDIFE